MRADPTYWLNAAYPVIDCSFSTWRRFGDGELENAALPKTADKHDLPKPRPPFWQHEWLRDRLQL